MKCFTPTFQISVIVPIYRVEKHIEQSLESLFTQTKTDGVEFILINDATPDNSMQIAREVTSKYPQLEIVFLENPVNKGLCSTRAIALKEARGEYVQFVDSDDWCSPTMLEDLYTFAKEQDADVVVSDLYRFNAQEERYEPQPITSNQGLQCAIELNYETLHGYIWNKFIKNSLFQEHPISVLEGVNMWEDVQVVTQIFCYAQKVGYLPKAYVHYRCDNAGSILNNLTAKVCEEQFLVMADLLRLTRERQWGKELEEAIIHRTFVTKYRTLLQFSGAELRHFSKLASELNTSIWSCSRLKFGRKVVLTLNALGGYKLVGKLPRRRL